VRDPNERFVRYLPRLHCRRCSLQKYWRELANRHRHVRPRREPGDDLLDLLFALPAGRFEDVDVVCLRQVPGEQLHPSQVDRALREQVEDAREPPGRTGDLDSVVRLPLRHREDGAAVRVERVVALTQMHVARVELGKVSDDLGGHAPLASDKALDTFDERIISQARQRIENVVLHICVLPQRQDTLVPKKRMNLGARAVDREVRVPVTLVGGARGSG
jgi:hypothetical protein